MHEWEEFKQPKRSPECMPTHIWKAWPAGQLRMAGCRVKSKRSASSNCSSGRGCRLPAVAGKAVHTQMKSNRLRRAKYAYNRDR